MDLCRARNDQLNEVGQLVCELSEEGRVVSIFENAVNIRISNGLLVSLVASSEQMTPMSVKCPDVFNRLMTRQLMLKVGDTVRIRHGRLTTGRLQIDLHATHRFDGTVDHRLTGRMDPDKIKAFRTAICALGRKRGMLGLIDEQQIDNPFVQKGIHVRDSILKARRSRLSELMTGFVGLGTGFTPSGDDLICGFLLGERVDAISATRGQPEKGKKKHRPFDAQEKLTIWRAAAGTNDGGRTLIWMALQDRFPGFLLGAVTELVKTEVTADIFRVVKAAVNRGHTSGTDALVGFLLYLHRTNLN